uniref:Peptidase_M1 domain-containing protein n=1 Tax=Panagrellus redivivus TaxID=6233 RepID=A0A7E4W487_PANRE
MASDCGGAQSITRERKKDRSECKVKPLPNAVSTTVTIMRKVAVVIFLEVLLVLRVVAGSSARLDGSVRPIVYDLKLTLSSALETISGQVEIEIQCITPTTTITLHAHPNYIKIHHSIIHDRFLNTSTSLELPEVNTKDHQTTFKLITPLTAGHVYYLSIWFTTRYSMAATKGFAQTHDVDRGTWMNSLLELQHARELLPCFDEPSYRSVFRLQLWLHSDFADDTYVALSNTDGIKEIWSETLSIWTFEPTLPIPSYLFTIAVGRFESFCRIPKNLREKKICIWRFADKEKWESMAEKVVEQMALFHQSMLDYLLVDPVARLHLLVIPMKLNGMENFGLLNIRESLWPQENDTISFNKFRKTLFHEMAHQWFGNLVTMHWWNDIWLSESITSFLSAIAPLNFSFLLDAAFVLYKFVIMSFLLPESQKIPLSKLPYAFRKRLIALSPLRIVNELSNLCPNIKVSQLFQHQAYDHVFITNNDKVYKWASTDTVLFSIFKILHQFAFFRFFLDGMNHTNPMWESVVHVRDIRRTKCCIYAEETLVLHFSSPNTYDYVIPYICGPYTRLILHGNIRGDQVLRLIHPGVKRVRINATIQMPMQQYGHFAEYIASKFQGFNSSFVLFNTPTVTNQLKSKMREAWKRHNHDYQETSGHKGRICIGNGNSMTCYMATIHFLAIGYIVAVSYMTELYGESYFQPIFIVLAYGMTFFASMMIVCLIVSPPRTDEIKMS